MSVTWWQRQFEATTRGRIVALLRRDGAAGTPVEALPIEVTGVSVREHCDRGRAPRGRFTIPTAS